jgi:WD40 repeat protein
MHNTGIQSLKWSNDGSYLFSSGGFEEFFVWKVTATPVLIVGVICESTLPVEPGSDLRISDFAIKELNRSGKDFSITLVYSNSAIKIFRYSTTEVTGNRWTLICQSHYTASCLTLVNLFEFKQVPLTITAATDGHITLWKQCDHEDTMLGSAKDYMDFIQPLRCIPIHQNAIKCLSMTQLSPTVALVLTGSDDNSIGITLLQHHHEGDKRFQILSSTLTIPRAHTASVTASAIFRLPESSKSASQDCRQLSLRAVTLSNDQRIKVWHITINFTAPGIGGMAVEKEGNVHTAVADVSSMAIFPTDVNVVQHESEGPQVEARRTILICGVGMEVWSMMA